ncbi:MAG: PF20097 family protein [Planctomycetota bacterium]|jgi:hypothetical protein
MKDRELKCPKCGGSMEKGFVVDYWHKAIICDSASQMEWAKGEPKVSSWDGTVKNISRSRVYSYSCDDCGYLESYVNR